MMNGNKDNEQQPHRAYHREMVVEQSDGDNEQMAYPQGGRSEDDTVDK